MQKIIQKIQNFWENDFGISQKFFHHHPKSSNSGTERRSSSPRWGNGQQATVYSNIIYGIYIYTEVYYFHTIIITHVIVLRIYIHIYMWLYIYCILVDVCVLGVFWCLAGDGSWSWHYLGFDVNIQLGIPRFPWLRSTSWSPAQPGISTNARARKKDGWASEASGKDHFIAMANSIVP